MSDQRIEIRREELFTRAVDSALETRRLLEERTLPELAEISPLRRWLSSSMLVLPVSGFLAALLAWLIIEPYFEDVPVIGGEVVLVETEPLDAPKSPWDIERPPSVIKLTIGKHSVLVPIEDVRLERGADGQPAPVSARAITPGTTIEAAGFALSSTTMVAIAIRPATAEHALGAGQTIRTGPGAAAFLFFPVTAILVALALLFAEGVTSRNWIRVTERTLIGLLLVTVFVFLSYIPAAICLAIGQHLLPENTIVPARASGPGFYAFMACRSAAWACLGAGLGLGMNLVRSTRAQLRNSVVGGLLGGALGGMFFDPIIRFFLPESLFLGADASRLVGMCAVGACVGFFVALVDLLAREAWLRVRTGPIAGKAFVLYRSPTVLGSSPRADVYLFKDAGIDPEHATITRAGNRFEIEDLDSRSGTLVGSRAVRRRRLETGDRIQLGSTILEFEERAARNG